MKTKLFLSLVFASVVLFLGVKAFEGKVKKTNSIKKVVAAEVIRKLEYDFNKASVREDYRSKLDEMAQVIKDENFAISLRGHADSIGKYKVNWVMSDMRAIEVKNYLVTKGVPEERIVTTPFGSTKPVATNKTPEGRQKNRRVEVTFTKVQ